MNLDELLHYGVARRSGRYPWGSGDDPHQGNGDIVSRFDTYRRKGFSEKEAAAAVGVSIAGVRAERSLRRSQQLAADISMANRLKAKGLSNVAIGERMNKNESSVRALLSQAAGERATITKNTISTLKDSVDKHGYVDVGAGVEVHLGVSSTRLNTALKALKNEGYEVIPVQTPQLGTDKKTTIKVLAPKGTTYKDIVTNKDKIRLPIAQSDDGGRSYVTIKPPENVSSKRVKVAWNEDGGGDKDGVIEIRRGAEDLSLGGTSKYAQVRIAVDGTHYLKGMAVYSDDLPPGVDIRFNTSKPRGSSKLDAFKKLNDDPDNPFGASISQSYYTDKSGKKRLSPINKVGSDSAPNEEGRWGQWSKSLSSQVLSKQPVPLAKQQLELAVARRKTEFDEINKLTNPVVKRHLMSTLADDADAAAIHLKAAALPRQMNHVILPVVDMPEHQVYAPNYKTGETVVLIRHPHGGTFEIPELVVNNNHRSAKRLMGDARDAVGISPKVAKRLSGADFDGDTVLVIPNNRSAGRNRIQTSAPLVGLKDFDPITAYPYVPGMKVMGEPGGGNKQRAMGDISNLITDMTIKGATPEEIARAVRHSMVVIDAEKHRLNHKLSEQENGIHELKVRYQGRKDGGASTLISKASSEMRVPERKEGAAIGKISDRTGKPTKIYVDPNTGEKLYSPTGASYTKTSARGVEKTVFKTSTITKMEGHKNAHELSSGTVMEGVYADHANALKGLANMARKAVEATENIPYNPASRKVYSKEVASLSDKLKAAKANKPLERRAQLIANDIVATKLKANPHLDRDDIKRLKGQALSEGRARVGAKKPSIHITPQEWVAIQRGAVHTSFLEQIIHNADIDQVRELATPRQKPLISRALLSRATSLKSKGYSREQIAAHLGIPVRAVDQALYGE